MKVIELPENWMHEFGDRCPPLKRDTVSEEVFAAYLEHTGHGPLAENSYFPENCEWCRRETMQEPFTRHTKDDFLKYNKDQLIRKRIICNLAIKVAKEEAEHDDRAPEVLEYYMAERKSINEAIKELLWDDQPPAQEIKIKQLNFGSQAKV